MRDALFQPASPVHAVGGGGGGRHPHAQPQPVVEEEIVAVSASAPVAATPFFDNDGGRKILVRGGTVVNWDETKVGEGAK